MRLFFSNTVTSCPTRASCCAAASPAGPEPTTATFLPVLAAGGRGTTQPSAQARSMIACSIDLMPTASSLMLSVHAASHGAGQIRPVNSGKLLVLCSVSIAARQSSRYTRSLKSGIRLLTGQPWMQNGVPQSMQRAPWRCACSVRSPRTNSLKFFTRVATGSQSSSMRSNSGNPVILPMLVGSWLLRRCDRLRVRTGLADRLHGLARRGHLAERAPVFVREDLNEARSRGVPVVDDLARTQASGPGVVLLDQRAQQVLVGLAAVPEAAVDRRLLFGARQHLLERDHRGVAAAGELAVLVPDVGDAARHPGGEVAPGASEHDRGAAGHVLAAVVAGALDDGGRTRQPHREALAGDAAEERLAAGRTVQRGVADDDVRGRVAAEVDRRPHDDAPARQPFAGVVVGVADQVQRDPPGEEGAEALSAHAFGLDEDRVVGQPFRAPADQLAREHRADRAVDVAHALHELHRLAALDRRPAFLDQLDVERALQAVLLHVDMAARQLRRQLRLVEDAAEVQAARLPVRDALLRVEQVRAAEQVVEPADAQLRHDAARLLGDEEEVIDDVLGLAS